MSGEQAVALCVFAVGALAIWFVIWLNIRAESRQQEWFDQQEYLPGGGIGVSVIVHTRPALEPADLAVYVYRPEVIDLCQRHGLDASRVAWIRRVGRRRLRFGVYLLDERGNRYLDPPCSCTEPPCKCTVAMREVEVALRGKLPGWWRPEHEDQP